MTRLDWFSNATVMYLPVGSISHVVTRFAGVCTAIGLPDEIKLGNNILFIMLLFYFFLQNFKNC